MAFNKNMNFERKKNQFSLGKKAPNHCEVMTLKKKIISRSQRLPLLTNCRLHFNKTRRHTELDSIYLCGIDRGN